MVLGLLFAFAATLGAARLMAFLRSGESQALLAMYVALLFGYWGGDAFQTAIMREAKALMSTVFV